MRKKYNNRFDHASFKYITGHKQESYMKREILLEKIRLKTKRLTIMHKYDVFSGIMWQKSNNSRVNRIYYIHFAGTGILTCFVFRSQLVDFFNERKIVSLYIISKSFFNSTISAQSDFCKSSRK